MSKQTQITCICKEPVYKQDKKSKLLVKLAMIVKIVLRCLRNIEHVRWNRTVYNRVYTPHVVVYLEKMKFTSYRV